jgi:hypothetical protein
MIVALGADEEDLTILRPIAAEFGWLVSTTLGSDSVAAILLRKDALGKGISWPDAVHRIRQKVGQARIVTCHGFRDQIDWGELYDLNTFHAIRLPMKEEEVRQSLGFVWEAERRAKGSAVSRRPTAQQAVAAFGIGDLSYAAH